MTYTFDHLPDPMEALSAARRLLDPQHGLLVLEVHDLEKIIRRREYCLFEHEHFTYWTAETLAGALARSGFRMLTAELLPERERRGNSLLVAAAPARAYGAADTAERASEAGAAGATSAAECTGEAGAADAAECAGAADSATADERAAMLAAESAERGAAAAQSANDSANLISAAESEPSAIDYSGFQAELGRGIAALDAFLEAETSAGRKVAGYGAGGRGVMTMAAMREAARLAYVCDANAGLHGRLAPKSEVPIAGIDRLAAEPVDTLLVFSYGYMAEIAEAVRALPHAPRTIVSMLEVLKG